MDNRAATHDELDEALQAIGRALSPNDPSFVKDVTTHHIGGSNVVANLRADFNKVPEVDRLPQSVADISNILGNQFEDTANKLEERAEALEHRAHQLRDMSKRLREAATHVPNSLREWVKTEINYRDAAMVVSGVNPDGNYS